MDAGKLRRVVYLQSPIESRNAVGEVEVTDWRDVFSTRAEVIPVAGRKFFAGQELQAEVTTVIRTRYRAGVNSKMRALHVIEFGPPVVTETYEILGVAVVNSAKREIQLNCRQLQDVGFRAQVTAGG